MDKKSKMLIQILDEILFEISNDEFNLIPAIVKIMQKNKLGIPLMMDVKKCNGSWANKEKYVLSAS